MSKTLYGAVLRRAREGKGFSQELVAEKLGISRTSYIQVEKGIRELTLDEARILTGLLNVEMEALLGGEQPDYEKYKQMILAFLRTNPDSRGKVPKTKLAKLLYLADFAWFYNHLESMSGMRYRRIQFGPVPDLYFRALDELFDAGKVDIEKKNEALLVSEAGGSRHAPLDLVTQEQKELIAKIAEKWRGKRTQEIVDFTHGQLPYTLCAQDELIPYELITQEDPGHVY